MASTQSDIKALVDTRAEAVWNKDLDRLMSLYAPGIVYFDLVPGLRYVGTIALRARFTEWFHNFESAFGPQTSELSIVDSGDLAAAHMLIRASGTLKTGRDVEYWVRTSNIFQRSNQR